MGRSLGGNRSCSPADPAPDERLESGRHHARPSERVGLEFHEDIIIRCALSRWRSLSWLAIRLFRALLPSGLSGTRVTLKSSAGPVFRASSERRPRLCLVAAERAAFSSSTAAAGTKAHHQKYASERGRNWSKLQSERRCPLPTTAGSFRAAAHCCSRISAAVSCCRVRSAGAASERARPMPKTNNWPDEPLTSWPKLLVSLSYSHLIRPRLFFLRRLVVVVAARKVVVSLSLPRESPHTHKR